MSMTGATYGCPFSGNGQQINRSSLLNHITLLNIIIVLLNIIIVLLNIIIILLNIIISVLTAKGKI